MKKVVFSAVILILSLTGCKKEEKNLQPAICDKIVSTAPSVTETFFELGLGEKIVGVSDNCKLPEKIKGVKRVGKVLDIGSESVAVLKPDTVVVLKGNETLALKMKNLNLNTILIDQSTVEGFFESVKIISEHCSIKEKGDNLIEKMGKELAEVTQSLVKINPLKVMVVVGRDYSFNGIKDVYIAGNDGFYDTILKMARLENVYQTSIAYPKIQLEGVMTLDPDIIIEVATMGGISDENIDDVRKNWEMLPNLKAVKNKKVFVVNDDYWSILGPRFIEIVKDIIEITK
ncbi:MAG: ABC transporter substrate-binding protein [bacterium]